MAENNDLGKTTIGMQANLAAMLSYLLGFITGIIFFVIEKENKYVRFHAMQSIVVFGGLFVIAMILPFIPVIGWVFLPVLWVIEVVIWLVLMIKAYKGEKFKFPVAGDIAEKNI
ncbi:MAG TPA: DUF4870 domain-containing protein [Candidatus Omnitrophota bacterium]|nr:DUF4870 domain-containing protein [Candidatus Omnitrophota bacterium]HPS19693.1 DUF4870 domain-containing protein [Candidatus Omnitrophota bacterium]